MTVRREIEWPVVEEPVELPMFISPPSDEAEKINMPVAEVAEQDAPTPAPIWQPEVAPKVSDAARALASFQRGRAEKTRPVAKPAPEPPRAVFASTGAIDLHYRPDRPAGTRGVEILTPDLMGDPAPGRSALAQRQSEGKA